MKTYYDLLGLTPAAAAEEVKSAFRREIARYHPDKVQHLGPEFQEIAATRAAELTEAYRILMDPASRATYDASILGGAPAAPPAPAAPAHTAAPPPAQERRPDPEQPQPHHVAESLRETRASVSVFVRKATINRMADVMAALAATSEVAGDGAFDAIFVMRPKRALFQRSDAAVRVAVKVVERVDAGAIEATWPLAVKLRTSDAVPCVLLCGSGLAAPRELAAAIAEQRRKTRQAMPPIVIPVDTRDWEALLPPDTPVPVRKLLERLKLGV